MTHSHHRKGSRNSLMKDWIVFTNDNRILDRTKTRRFNQILQNHNPVSLGTASYDLTEIQPPKKESWTKTRATKLRYIKGWDKSQDSGSHTSSTLEEIQLCKDLSAGGAVFSEYDDLVGVIKDLKEADLGICTVVSGIFDELFRACKEAGIKAHTINMSGGVHGRVDLLPDPWILEITTMCGHAAVSPYLVKHLLQMIKTDKISIDRASVEMAKQCVCGFFNVDRAKEILNKELLGKRKNNT